MNRLALCILCLCFAVNAPAATHLWVENQKELVIASADGKAIKLRTIDQPLASKLSPDGSVTYVIRSTGATLDIYENSSRNLTKSVELSGRIKQIEASGSNLYLLDEVSRSIRVLDALTLSEKSAIVLKDVPTSFSYNSARDEFYVGLRDASLSVIKNGKERGNISDLYRSALEIHFSNKWQKLLVRSESFIAVFDIDDLAFKRFLDFEGRPGRIELDAQQDFAFIQYTDRNKIEKFSLSTLRSEEAFYTDRKDFLSKKINPSTFQVNQDSLNFYDAASGKVFGFEESSAPLAPPTPTQLPPGVTASGNININQADQGPQFGPSVQVDSSSNMVFSWTTDPAQNGEDNIKGREFNSDGTAAGPEFQLNKTSVNPQNSSMVAVRNNGDFMAVWNEQSERDGQGWGIFGRRFGAGAIELDPADVIIPSNPIGKQIYPVIAFGNGVYIAAWAGPTDGSGRGVWMRRFDAATGIPIDVIEVPVNTSIAGEPWALDIAANPNGEFVIVWRDDSNDMDRIRARPYNANGTPKTPTDFRCGPYNVGAQRNFSPNVGIANDGSFVVVWLEAGAGGIVGERFDSNANSIEKFIATTGQTGPLQDNPSVDVASNGSFFVGWKDAGYTMFEAIGRYFNNLGDAQGNDFRIPNTPPVNDDFSPNVAFTEQNNFVVAWYGRGRSPNIMARMFTVAGGSPTLSINDVSLFEGDSGTTQAVFTVTLSSTVGSDVTVDFATADGSATNADNDYEPTSGTLTIPANMPSGTISVTINGDAAIEPNEQFTVNLTNPTNATISDAQGIGTIQDDDTPVIPVVSIGDISVAEGSVGTTTATFTILISAPIDEQITMDFQTDNGTAQSPLDFVDTDIPITVPINTTSFTVDVTIVSDLIQEGNETFTATLSNISSNATLGDATATATILDDECTYCDGFDDGILPNWILKLPAFWSETGGHLVVGPAGSIKLEGDASPVFTGCSTCTFTSGMKSTATTTGYVTLIAWFVDKNNKVELQMKEGRDKWTLRQRRNGNIVAKKSVSQTIDPDTLYQAEIRFDGTVFHLLIDSVEILTLNASGIPNGTVGVGVRRAIGSFDHVTVLP